MMILHLPILEKQKSSIQILLCHSGIYKIVTLYRFLTFLKFILEYIIIFLPIVSVVFHCIFSVVTLYLYESYCVFLL